eukprot:3438695-Lingulodinium_polyedra.AAC.1
MQARAGQPILPDDMCVVTWGIMGDMEYLQNELGLPHHANKEPKPLCGWCTCSKTGHGNNWFDFQEGVPWHRNSCRDSSVFDHPVNSIIGWTPWHFTLDWLHVLDLGCASHACGNILYTIVYQKLAQKTRADAMNQVAEQLA